MPTNKLLMDIGNSRCKWSLLASDSRSADWLEQGSWDNQQFQAEHWLQQLAFFTAQSIKQLVIATVASDHNKALLSDYCREVLGLEAQFIHSAERYQGDNRTLTNSYQQPLALGVDRWLAMIGALQTTDAGFAVLDAGTAITIDLVDHQGKHLGGHIVPGHQLMQRSLFGDTGKIAWGAKLDSVAANEQQWLGLNSQQAVELGCLQAALGYLQSCFARFDGHYGIKKLFVCGGDGMRMMEMIELPAMVELIDAKDLVLKGLFYAEKAQ